MALSFDELKERLRAAFIRERRRKQPFYQSGEELEKALDSGVQNCIAAKITPEDYCTALYRIYVNDQKDNFFPNQLRGTRALNIAKQFIENYERVSYKQLWDTQLVVLKHAIDKTKRSVEEILIDHALPFSPWFRIIATIDPVPAIIARYREAAKAETTPALLEFLKEVAPQNLSRIQSL